MSFQNLDVYVWKNANTTYSDRWIWISPENVTKETRVRNITRPCDVCNLFHLAQLRTQTTMHADDFVIDDCGTRKAVEGVTKRLPKLDAEAATAFIIEPIYPVDSCTFMVPTQDEKVFWVLDLIRKEKTHNLKRLFSSIDIVTKE